VIDPSEDDFRKLFKIMSKSLEVEYCEDALDHLIATHYKAVDRPMRCCQPRDLLMQVRNHCLYMNEPARMTKETVDFAVLNYFAIM
jgi:hypothetical protein